MSCDEIKPSENGCSSSDGFNQKNILKSLMVSESDPLKIKLKISKMSGDENVSNDGSGQRRVREIKSDSNSPLEKLEVENGGRNTINAKIISDEETIKANLKSKRKLRSKKHGSTHLKHEEGVEENKKKLSDDKEFEKRKKRGKVREMIASENWDEGVKKRSRRNEEPVESEPLEVPEDPLDINKESFCWTCHKDGSVVKCDTCPRVFHLKCVSLSKDPSKNWICPECSLVLHAEKMSTRSEAMKSLSLEQLCTLLNFAIGRMKNVPESEAFWKPVDPKEVPFYDKYITNPMDLNLLERNMKAKMYGSPQAFLADTKWLLHNSIIFNSTQSPLTSTARFLVKICRQEMAEIENCPDCYLNAHTKENWFIEVCRKPHILIWARLKGFPFWPAKAMSTNLKTQQVDARFFGAHDKAWVPVKECFLYSKSSPQLFSKKRADLDGAFLEAEGYIKKIKQKFGSFCYAPDKTPFRPEMYDKQLQSLIPNYKEEKPGKKKRKSETSLNFQKVTTEKSLPQNNGTKKVEEHLSRVKLKRPLPENWSDMKVKDEEDICLINDEYVSDQKVIIDGFVSPEDEIARRLEMYDTHKKMEGEAVDDNSTDVDEDHSIRIPEHAYSRQIKEQKIVQSSLSSSEEISGFEKKGFETLNDSKISKTDNGECTAESSDVIEQSKDEKSPALAPTKSNTEQCEVSSTSTDLKITETQESNDDNYQAELDNGSDSSVKSPPIHSGDKNESNCEINSNADHLKKDDDRIQKSFVNLSCDQQQKILNEAKLLANIDEMTALGKQKVLNELGLDASQVDIRQLAQENRQILETLSKKCHNQGKEVDEDSSTFNDIKKYLNKENDEESVPENVAHSSPKLGSIKVRDFNVLSKSQGNSSTIKRSAETKIKIMDVQSLRDVIPVKGRKCKVRKSLDDTTKSKKLKLDPQVELIKLGGFDDQSMEKLNRKLRLSDEVSLLMVDVEKKRKVDADRLSSEGQQTSKISSRHSRAKKSMSNRPKNSVSDLEKKPKNINIISVDTENSIAQKNLLKSLRLEEKKPNDENRKAVLMTNGKGVKNTEGTKGACESVVKSQVKEVTVETVKDFGKGNEQTKDISAISQKNLTLMANSHLIVTNNGPAIVTSQNSQQNLAMTQNNLGQLSLVHLSNLTSGIQTNFVNLTNETIGFNNSIGTLYATPGFNSDFATNSGMGSVILTPGLTGSLPSSGASGGSATAKLNKLNIDGIKIPINKGVASKNTSGISVKSPASLGLVNSQLNKLPQLLPVLEDGAPSSLGEIGSVTSELNKHSLKLAEYMRATIEDILRELSSQGSLEAKYKLLSLEMEKLQWRHQQEIIEIKHHSERSLIELRNALESEKQKCLGELKAQLETQHQKIISETKRKQWCANCGKEALFYCCWNTSYCDYPCQQQHWPGHMSTCAQLGNNVSIGTSPSTQLSPCVCLSLITRKYWCGFYNYEIIHGITMAAVIFCLMDWSRSYWKIGAIVSWKANDHATLSTSVSIM